MKSFKFKLVASYAVVALLPAAGGFYALDALATHVETQRVDGRLHSDLRAALAGYAQQLRTAERRALPPSPAQAVVRLAPAVDPHDVLVALEDGRVATGPSRGERLPLLPGQPHRVRLGSHLYRGLAGAPVAGPARVQFAVLVRERELDAAIAAARWKIGAAIAALLVLCGLLVYALGLSIVRTLGRLAQAADEIARGRFQQRVPVSGRDEFGAVAAAFNRMAAQLEQRIDELEHERRRTRELTLRFGRALAATHDVDLLLRVIVETMVEATGARGGSAIVAGRELAHTGDGAPGEGLELPLTVRGEAYGRVLLRGDGFDEAQAEIAWLLAAQAMVALENAQLHRIVEWQALVDPLTGLANRRALEESLEEEVSRAIRFGGDVCLVLADLDRFKRINDVHGHPAGDRALRLFGRTLRDVVRDIDSTGRWGGEEFALVLPGTDDAGGAAVAERIRASLAELDLAAEVGAPLRLTASFGVATLVGTGELTALVAAADEALYRAKREGRDRVVRAADVVRR